MLNRLVLLVGLVLAAVGCDGPGTVDTRNPSKAKPTTAAIARAETADFAAGCFWGSESTFQTLPGVISTEVGYEGGHTENPTYQDVCTDQTGYAETVRVKFDPAVVSYDKLLDVFFEHHDPTTLNSQGPDFGTQYRSAIFVHSPVQQVAAQAAKDKRNASGDYVGPIVTEVAPAAAFFRAEEYHQQYFQKKGSDATCHLGNGKSRVGD